MGFSRCHALEHFLLLRLLRCKRCKCSGERGRRQFTCIRLLVAVSFPPGPSVERTLFLVMPHSSPTLTLSFSLFRYDNEMGYSTRMCDLICHIHSSS